MESPSGQAAPGGEPVPPRFTPQDQGVFRLKTVFFGPRGFRSGWRLGLFFLLADIASFGRLASLFEPRLVLGEMAAGDLISGEAYLVVAVLVATTIMALLERRTFADYALPMRQAFGGWFWKGAPWGLASLSALIGLIRLGHGFDFGSVVLREGHYALLWALGFLLVAIFEEGFWRAYALSTLAEGIGFWPAAAVLSILFGGLHIFNGGETWWGAFAAILIGLFFCFTLRRTGNLWFAIGLHFGWDYAESFIYAVPDSGVTIAGHLLNSSLHGPVWLTGGTVGPEASVFVFLIIAALFVVFSRVYREARFPRPGRLHPPEERTGPSLTGISLE
jgi:CAAX protease family protein